MTENTPEDQAILDAFAEEKRKGEQGALETLLDQAKTEVARIEARLGEIAVKVETKAEEVVAKVEEKVEEVVAKVEAKPKRAAKKAPEAKLDEKPADA